MFTGIITATAAVRSTKRLDEGLRVSFERPGMWDDLALGESVSTDGVCLTVEALRADEYDCLLMPETLRVSSYGKDMPARVNLERALGAGGRFGGHFLQGHVDGVGTVERVEQRDGYDLWVRFSEDAAGLVIHKGSIAINGVSLTVAEVSATQLRVALIPHTLQHTTLGGLKSGDSVNLEFDMIGKYVERLMKVKENHAKG